MAFSKPFTQRERDYVRDRWPDESAEEIASDLRRSVRGVYKLINDMHLRESPEPPMQEGAGRRPRREPGGGCAAPGGDDASRLAALRDLLWADLLQAGPKDAPRLSEEYRNVLAAIATQEGRGSGDGGDRDGGDGDLSDILDFVRSS